MKNKLFKGIIALLLTSILLFSACAPSEGNNNNNNGNYTKVANTTDLDYKPNDTNIVLASNGSSDYKIVINDVDPNGDLAFASSDLQTLFAQSTGATLPIITDVGLTFNENDKYIVLGNNDVSSGSGMTLSYAEFGEDGSHIKRIGNVLLINSVWDCGAKYGIYEFLWYNLGIRIYAMDEIKMPDLRNSTVYLKDFDYKNIPDFAERCSGLNERKGDETVCYRLGYNKGHGENWYLWCHTSFNLIPKNTYYADHPDWYNDVGNQLCYSNEEMFEEMVKNIKDKINTVAFRRNAPGFFQIGLEDNQNFCACDRCKQVASENGGNSGVLMLFMNKLADVLNPWLKETYPDVEPIKWVTFAYASTVDPPVKMLDDGTYVPYNENVVAHENVGIMFAPLRANWAYSLTDVDKNPTFANMINGWKVIEPEVYVYTYTQIYDASMYYNDNWSTIKDQYQTWVDMGAKYIFDEGGNDGIPFSELRDYVHGKMFWDVESDVEYYIDDFMNNYFKVAAPYVKEYFNRLRTHYELIERDLISKGDMSFGIYSYLNQHPSLGSKDYWDKDWLLSSIAILDRAIEEAEKLPDGSEKNLILKRVREERISPIYILMDLYRFELSKTDIAYYTKEFESACEESGITSNCQHKTLPTMKDVVGEWSLLLNS